MSISDEVQSCIVTFDTLVDPQFVSEEQHRIEFQDSFDRFKIWMNNSGANRSGTMSLEYRLKDASHIQEMVLILLRSVLEAKEEIGGLLRHSPGGRALETPFVDEDSDLETDEGEAFSFANELAEVASHISTTVTCLLRLSMAISHPAPHDRFMKSGNIDTTPYEPFDIAHVRSKFPSAEQFLIERLGKAISRRRLYLKYRERRKDLRMKDLVSEDRTVASSLPSYARSLSLSDLQDDSMFEDSLSMTSYVTTQDGQAASLSVPRIPAAGLEGKIFECPLCFTLTSVKKREDWKYVAA
jgi:hypothetical protein